MARARRWSLIAGALVAACSNPQRVPARADPCDLSGAICTWMGVPGEAMLSDDSVDRLATRLYLPVDLTFAPDGTAYFPDYNNHRIRKVGLDGVVTTVSGTGFEGDGPGQNPDCWEGCDAATSGWNHPTGVAVDPDNPDQLYVAAFHNNRVDRIDQSTGTMSWYAGDGTQSYASPSSEDSDGDGFADGDTDRDGSVLDQAELSLPSGLAFGPDGALYVVDPGNDLIRRITDQGITDVAGAPGVAGYAGDGGPATEALLHCMWDERSPSCGLAIDGSVLYVADGENGVLRSIDLDSGVISTVDGAAFDRPRDVAVGLDGELYVAEPLSNCVRVLVDGVVRPFAGTCEVGGEGGSAGDGGPAEDALLYNPYGVAVDAEGNVYVADTNNQVVRRVKR